VPDSELIATMGRTLADVYGELAGAPADAAAMIATYRAWNEAHHDRMVRAYPGIEGALRELRGRGARLAVVTSKARALARRGLAVAGLDPLFSVVIGGDDVARGKPDPLPVVRALEVLGAQAAGSVMVGDSLHDMLAGRRAGVRTAAALWGPFSREQLAATEPDHYLESAAQLLDLA
jgi:pyrophosphatase PpaX